MSNKVFIDTNIWLYALIESDDSFENVFLASKSVFDDDFLVGRDSDML